MVDEGWGWKGGVEEDKSGGEKCKREVEEV